MRQLLNCLWISKCCSIAECCSIAKYFFLALAFCVVTIFLSVSTAKFLNFWLESDLSSWVQAVGTIFAITGGFFATIWQINLQRNRLYQQTEQIYKSTYDAAYYVCIRMRNVESETPRSHRQRSSAEQAIKIIQNIPYIFLSHSFQDEIELLGYFNLILIKLVAVNEGINDYKDKGSDLNSSNKNLDEAEELWKDWNIALKGYGIDTKPFPRNECT